MREFIEDFRRLKKKTTGESTILSEEEISQDLKF
jgi:hypothetical protein